MRLSYSRLKAAFVANAVQAAPGFKLVPVNLVDLFSSEKDRFLYQMVRPSGLFGETAEQAGMLSTGLPLGLSELLIGSIADAGRFPVRSRCPVLRFGWHRRGYGFRLFGHSLFNDSQFSVT